MPEGREGPEGVLTRRPARALAERTVLVTRPAGQEARLVHRLRSCGAAVVHIPTIRIEAASDETPLLEAVGRIASYDWIVLTSVNGVDRLWAALERTGRSAGALSRARVAAIGPATAAALDELGVRPTVVPERYRAEALVSAILASAGAPAEDRPLRGRRVLLPRAAEARDVLPRRLREAGAVVDQVPAYETRVERAGAERLSRSLDAGSFDWLTFTASSTVRAYVALVGARSGGARIAAIGPITARTARAFSLEVDAVARDHTADGLVDAIVDAEDA